MNRMMMRACALSLAGVLATQPAAAEWITVFTTQSGTTLALDSTRIRQVGGKRQIWVKSDHSRDPSERARSSMTMYSVDCTANTYRTLARTSYDSYGKVINSQTRSDYGSGIGYDPITPETIMEGIARVACAELEN